MNGASPVTPVIIIPPSELKENGGSYYVLGQAVTPISGELTPPDGSVTAAKIDSGAATIGQVLTADGAGGAGWEDVGGGGATFTANPDAQILVWDSEGIGGTPIEAQVDVTTRIPAAAAASVVWFWVRLENEAGGSSNVQFKFREVGSTFGIPNVTLSVGAVQFMLMIAPLGTDENAGKFEIEATGSGSSVVVRVYPLAVL